MTFTQWLNETQSPEELADMLHQMKQQALPPDPVLQGMSNKELKKLWKGRPQYAQSAGDMDWIRVAKEIRSRRRFDRWED